MTEHENHLSSEQIEWFLEPRDFAQGSVDSRRQLFDQASDHLATCEKCQRLVVMHAEWHRILNGLGQGRATEPTSECPNDATLTDLAAGIIPVEEAQQLLTHISHCSHCGPRLRDSVAVMREDSPPEEQAFLDALDSSQPAWQSRVATILGDASRSQPASTKTRPSWAVLFSWPRLGFAAVTLALIVVATLIGTRVFRSPSAEQLLARAYTEQRTLEVRIPGAQYAPLRVERGNDGSTFSRPEPLLRAEALISESLQRNPNDPTWLQAKARAELLDGNSDDAVRTLERALESEPDSPSLLADLGSAYYLRAKSTRQPVDYGRAVDFLGRALAKTPDDPVALFNHALACEQIYLYAQAVEDWEHYLRVDSRGGWAEEARKRLALVREKLQQHEHSTTEPLLSPSAIAKASPVAAELRSALDDRIETYIHIAMTEWLPEAFKADASDVSSNNARAWLPF